VKKCLPLAILSLALLCFLIVSVYASETFTVPSLSQTVRTVNLSQGDSVSGSISVYGGSGNDIDFHVTDPNGNTILSYARVTDTSFSFSASITGTYKMVFDNSFSLISSKSVTLDYSVQPSVLGIPLNTLLIIAAVVVVLIIIVAIGVVLSRRSHVSRPYIPSEQVSPTRVSVQEKPRTEFGFCPYCGTPREKNAIFCKNCGKSLP
jgi:hypothetical protein